jgi:hypothetical protein
MRLLRPVPRRLATALTAVILLAWVLQMAALVQKTLAASHVSLAGDLSRYGTSAQWRGVYSRGEKIGFLVGQTVKTADGFELQEDGRLQMTLLGASSAAALQTRAVVDRDFNLRSFTFSLDPGTGKISVAGTLDGKRLRLTVTTPTGTRDEVRDLPEVPALSLNLPRRLAAAGLVPGTHLTVAVFDPATLRNAPMTIDVEAREVVRPAGRGRPIPAFRLKTTFAGVQATSWVTDTGEVLREESPLGLIVVRETQDRAMMLAVPGQIQMDLLENAAIQPQANSKRIDQEEAVQLLRVRLEGVDLSSPEVQGAGQTVTGDVVEVVDPETLTDAPADPDPAQYLKPEVFLESDAPEIVAEAKKAVQGVSGPRKQAERLVRYVGALLEKKPTVSLPSAVEVLRTRVGDCNEHTALYVAMARSLGIPARIAVGVVHLRGAFYYHAWPEVRVEGAPGRTVWLPVDPTLNQFPADATHIRLARGGLDRQAAILPAIGHARLTVLELKVRAGSIPVVVGRTATDRRPPQIDLPKRDASSRTCWSRPAS